MKRAFAVGAVVLTALLSVQLTVVGAMQVVGAEPIRTNIADMGYPGWFRVGLGIAQVGGVALLWSRRTRFAAAIGLAAILVGAAVSHLRFGHDAEHTAPAVVTLALLSLLAWMRRPNVLSPAPSVAGE